MGQEIIISAKRFGRMHVLAQVKDSTDVYITGLIYSNFIIKDENNSIVSVSFVIEETDGVYIIGFSKCKVKFIKIKNSVFKSEFFKIITR